LSGEDSENDEKGFVFKPWGKKDDMVDELEEQFSEEEP
jgi:hypothetical protein